jgi:hypothetical protein
MKKIFFILCGIFLSVPLWAAHPASALFEFNPVQIDFGILKPGKIVHSTINMSKKGSGPLDWFLEDPAASRNLSSGKLKGRLTEPSQSIVVALKYDGVVQQSDARDESPASGAVQIGILAGDNSVKYELQQNYGSQSVSLRFRSRDLLRTIIVKYEILEQDVPVLNVEPSSIDLGSASGDTVTNLRLKIENKGVEKLHWKVSSPRLKKDRGRYISFYNEGCKGKGTYTLPERLEQTVQMNGKWKETEGFPAGDESVHDLTILFIGNGGALSIRKDVNAGNLSMFLDEVPLDSVDCNSENRGWIEVPFAEKLKEGPRRLKLNVTGGGVLVKGMRIYSRDIKSPPPGWITLSPNAGETTSESDYVNIRLSTDKMEPGLYADSILFQSNGGDLWVDLSVRVTGSDVPKIISVYKFIRGSDFLFTAYPEREDKRILKFYKRQGIAFRLFKENTPGTKKLYRWYHPGKGDHFYSSESEMSHSSLHGYILEGSIGNIATAKLPGTRELYQWHNVMTGLHFYTTDIKGEGYGQKGYKFESIIGYVR